MSASDVSDNSRILIKARVKDGPSDEYPTRILSHLRDFAPRRAVKLSRYGGCTGQQREASGFFRTEKIDGRWWLIDPEGNRFLHLAVNAVRPGHGPQMKRAFAARFPTEQEWRDETAALLHAHGFNGTGSWSADPILAASDPPLVYTPILNFMSAYGRKFGRVTQASGHMAYPNNCIFVFDPEFEAFADQHAKQLTSRKDDPHLLGYFSDNELPFFPDLLDCSLALPAGDPGRAAAEAWLAQREKASPDKSKLTDEDREAWRAHVAETYFRIVAEAIKKYDPNHLFLGSRFYERDKESEALLRAAGRYLDVISVNVYRLWTPRRELLTGWSGWAGKPVMITEWYAKGDDTGMENLTGAGWTVPTQQDRGRFYQNFTLGLLESQVCVGWSWFKYQDNDPEDETTDPSNRNSNKGIVSVTYEPYQALLNPMKELNEVAYPLTEYFDRKG